MSTEPRTYVTRGGEVREVPMPLPSKGKRNRVDNAGLSKGKRLTKWNNDMIASGTHPATLRSVFLDAGTCGECIHHQSYEHYSSRKKTYHKCDIHRLGMSHSEQSDIRVSWPACTAFEKAPVDG